MTNHYKIGLDAKRAFHNFRGLGNYSRTLIEGLERYNSQFDLKLYTPPFKESDVSFFTKELHRAEILGPRSALSKTFHPLWRSFTLSSNLSDDSIDLYHGLSHELPYGIEKFKGKKIVTIHDLIYLRYPEFFPWIDRKIYHKKFTYSTQSADKIIAICEQTKKDLIHYLKTPAEKIEVIYQACHPRFYEKWAQTKIAEVKRDYKLPNKPYILYVGAFEKRKNLINLIHAFDIVSHHYDFDLVLVGNGRTYKDQMINLVDHYGLKERVHFLNDVKEDDLPGLYQGSHLFVFPSLYEGFGLPIVEALFSEVPVITSQGSCFPESGGPSSAYIDPYSVDDLQRTICEILSSEARHYQMKTEGRLFVEKFHLQNTTKKLSDFYWSVINDKLVSS